MAEEKSRSGSSQSKKKSSIKEKAIEPIQKVEKPAAKKAENSIKKEEILDNKKILSHSLFKPGDLIQASVFCGKRGSAKIIEISSDIVTVEFEGKIYTTKVKNIRKIKE